MFFYLCFPLVAPLIDRARRLWLLAGGLVGGTLVAVATSILFVPDAHQVWFVYGFPLTRLLEFAVGMVVARLLLTRRLPRIPLMLALAVTAVAYLCIGFFVTSSKIALTGFSAVTVIPFALLIISAAQSDILGRWSALRNPWLVRLGDWSFAFYLVHGLVLYYGGVQFLPQGAPLWQVAIFTVAAFITATVASWLLHHFVERPAERRLRGRARVVPVKHDVHA
jgi:peptidoglycan/LPS O-acetylase OafA/YrhL